MLLHIRTSQNKIKGLFYRLLFIGYTLFLFTVTLLPGSIISSEGKGWLTKLSFGFADKLTHLLLFFGFTLLLSRTSFVKRKIFLFLIPVLIGLIIEVLQELSGWGRTFEWADVLANAAGALLAMILIVGNFFKT